MRPLSLLLIALAALASVCMAPRPAHAEWLPNGNPVATITGEQLWPKIVPDARGGAFVVWDQNIEVWAQHLSGDGDVTDGWPAAGIEVPPYPHWSTHWRIDAIAPVPDGEGGVYVTTLAEEACVAHCGGSPGQLHVQRLGADGMLTPGWTADGVQIEPPLVDRHVAERTKVVSDGRQGLFVAWITGWLPYIAPFGKVLHLQYVAPDGALPCGESGIVVAEGGGLVPELALVSDGTGGALVFWARADSAGRTRLFGQHVSSHGRLLWPEGGVPVTDVAMPAFDGPWAVSDGKRGAIVAWQSGGTPPVLRATRVAMNGRRPWEHEAVLCSAPGQRTSVQIAPSEEGGATVAWLDTRDGVDHHVYAQRVLHTGEVAWTSSGVPVCTTGDTRSGYESPGLALAGDGRDGAFLAWGSVRPEGRLFATRLTRRGEPAEGWPVNGALISEWPEDTVSRLSEIEGPWIAATDVGRAIISWDAYQEILSGPMTGGWIEQAFVTLLESDGPAASPGAAPGPAAATPVREPVPRPVAPAFALYGVRPNPGPRDGLIRFALPDAAPATLQLFDVAGRQLWSREVGALGPGEHAVRLADGAWLPPGVYLARLRQGERAATVRLAILP